MAYPKKDRCRRGHKYTPENTRVDKHGHRYCRQCQRERYQKKPRPTVCRNGLHDLTVEGNVDFDAKGRRRGCKPCRKATRKRWEHQNKDYARKSRFRIEYGISVEDYDRMYDEQEGLCKICLTPEERYRMHTDHCHQRGRVRGLLCRNCNSMLGHAKDNPEVLRRGAEYLEMAA